MSETKSQNGNKNNKVFISYAQEDRDAAKRLYNDLKNVGLEPWLEAPRILTGQIKDIESRKAIQESRFFIALLSKNSVRERGNVQKQLRGALDVFKEFPESETFLIPARLDDCGIPFNEMEDIQYADLFPIWEEGIEKMLQAMGITNSFEFAIEHNDIADFSSDVIALKYAQYFYGADLKISKILENEGVSIDSLCPSPNEYRYVETSGSIKARFVLFVGVLPLQEFTYKEIREFSTQVIDIVSKEMPHVEHIAMTIHGPGFGLDEVESLLAQFAGVQDAMLKKKSNSIKRISIVDRNHERVQRLRNVLQKNLASVNYVQKLKPDGALYRIHIGNKINRVIYGDVTRRINTLSDTPSSINSAGFGSESKPRVFVAMPFQKEMEDVFYFGIQEPTHSADLLCERIDNEAFTGDVLEQVKEKIKTAAVVIADLTGANPNVYLEIGYAWGKGRPTILLASKKEEVKFDVRGQRYLKYETIMELRKVLSNELKQLKSKGII